MNETDANGQEGTDRPWRDPAVLHQMYHELGMSLREIADELGGANSTVYKNTQNHGVEARSREVHRANSRTIDDEAWQFWDATHYRTVRVHQLVAVAAGADPHEIFARGQVVHHRNKIPWDNRPKNLEVMSQAEHVRNHSLQEERC